MSLNDVKITSDECFSFIKAKNLVVFKAIIAAVFALILFIPIKFTVYTVILKIISAIVFSVALAQLIATPKNGLYVYQSGKIKLVSGILGGGEFEITSLKRAAVNFSEWENGEFSADIKFVTEDGEIFKKEYASKFESTSNHIGLSTYTIPRSLVDEYCQIMAEMNVFNISVIDSNKDIVYQYIKK